MNDIYRTFYETVGKRYPEDEITYATISGILRKKWITNKIKTFARGNLLDCGCNVGRLSASWLGGAVFGIDISYAVLARGKNLFPTTHFIHGDLRDLGFIRDQSIDNAIACEVLEHLDSPLFFLKHLYRVMKPGSKFLTTVPGYTQHHVKYIPLGILRSYGVTSGTKGDLYLHHAYKPTELVELVQNAGFTILDSGSFERELRLWQKPLTLIENLFYVVSNLVCPDSQFNRLFQRTMDSVKINIFLILDMFGLSPVLNRLIKDGRRSFVLATK